MGEKLGEDYPEAGKKIKSQQEEDQYTQVTQLSTRRRMKNS